MLYEGGDDIVMRAKEPGWEKLTEAEQERKVLEIMNQAF